MCKSKTSNLRKVKKFNRPPLTSTDFGLLLYYNEFP